MGESKGDGMNTLPKFNSEFFPEKLPGPNTVGKDGSGRLFLLHFFQASKKQIQDNRKDILSQMIVGYDTSCTVVRKLFQKVFQGWLR